MLSFRLAGASLSAMERGRKEGRKGGREEGRKGGREEGRKGGREEGRKGGRREEADRKAKVGLPSVAKLVGFFGFVSSFWFRGNVIHARRAFGAGVSWLPWY